MNWEEIRALSIQDGASFLRRCFTNPVFLCWFFWLFIQFLDLASSSIKTAGVIEQNALFRDANHEMVLYQAIIVKAWWGFCMLTISTLMRLILVRWSKTAANLAMVAIILNACYDGVMVVATNFSLHWGWYHD